MLSLRVQSSVILAVAARLEQLTTSDVGRAGLQGFVNELFTTVSETLDFRDLRRKDAGAGNAGVDASPVVLFQSKVFSDRFFDATVKWCPFVFFAV
jgi:hypothetical protein